MIVYVEYVIFDNFLMDLFIGLLLVEKIGRRKYLSIISAIIGTGLALVFPMVPDNLSWLYKILTLLCCCIPFSGKSLYEYGKSVVIYSIIGFVYAGCVSLFFGFDNSIIAYSDGMKVGVISLCCIVGYFCILKIIKIINKKMQKDKLRSITFVVNGKKIKTTGFLDNGNVALASDGNGIIFLDKKLSKRFTQKVEDYVFVSTISGGKICEVIKIDKIEIYFDGENHIYKNVNAVKTGQSYDGFQVLLSTKLKEI